MDSVRQLITEQRKKMVEAGGQAESTRPVPPPSLLWMCGRVHVSKNKGLEKNRRVMRTSACAEEKGIGKNSQGGANVCMGARDGG